MAGRIHTVMQNTNNSYTVSRDTKVNGMALDNVSTISQSNLIARGGNLRRLRQFRKRHRYFVDVTLCLIDTPFLAGVNPNGFKIALRSRIETIFSHALRALLA